MTHNFEQIEVEPQTIITTIASLLAGLETKVRVIEEKVKAIEKTEWKLLSALGYKNGWEDMEATRKGEYRKDGLGNVQLRGIIKSGTSGKAAVELPAGLLPKQTKEFAVIASGSIADIQIGTTGLVAPFNYAAGSEVKTFVYLDGVTYSPE